MGMRLIDADTLTRALTTIDRLARSDKQAALLGRVYYIVSKQPTVDAEPVRHGYWIGTEFDGYADGAPVYDEYECSVCGDTVGASYFNGMKFTMFRFCPHCGAKMDGDAHAAD